GERSVGVGGWLEIGDKSMDFVVASAEPADALLDLVTNALPRQSPAGAEAAVVAEGASAHGHRAIDVRAGEAGVDADLLHPGPELMAQEMVVAVVAEPSALPVEVGRAVGGGFGLGDGGQHASPYLTQV